MKTESLAHRADAPSTGVRRVGVRADQWLADLERALWDARDQHRANEGSSARVPFGERANPRDAGSAAARPQEHDEPVTAMRSADRNVDPPACAEARQPLRDAAVESAILEPRRMPEASLDLRAFDDGRGALGIERSTLAPAVLQSVAAEAADPLSPLLANSVPQAAVRGAAAPSLVDPSEPPSSHGVAPPHYAARVLQINGDGDLQVNLRDAALDAASEASVAQSLFAEMRAAGLPVRRLYVNGKLFVPDVEGSPSASSPILFPSIYKD